MCVVFFCDDNFIDIAFKGKGGGAGNPATHFHQQQPIILLKNRLFCVFSFILIISESYRWHLIVLGDIDSLTLLCRTNLGCLLPDVLSSSCSSLSSSTFTTSSALAVDLILITSCSFQYPMFSLILILAEPHLVKSHMVSICFKIVRMGPTCPARASSSPSVPRSRPCHHSSSLPWKRKTRIR